MDGTKAFRRIAFAALAAVAVASTALVAGRGALAATGACSTRGLAFSASARSAAPRYRVVGLRADHVSCTKARAIADRVAKDLLHSRPIQVPGVEGLGITEQTCTGCAPTTQVVLTYPRGRITVSLRGAAQTPVPSGGPSGVIA